MSSVNLIANKVFSKSFCAGDSWCCDYNTLLDVVELFRQRSTISDCIDLLKQGICELNQYDWRFLKNDSIESEDYLNL